MKRRGILFVCKDNKNNNFITIHLLSVSPRHCSAILDITHRTQAAYALLHPPQCKDVYSTCIYALIWIKITRPFMSSTNSSDQLTLLSYATFNYHIPIQNNSWRQHQWKQTMVALASLALQSAKKLFQKGNLENKSVIFTLPRADVCARSVGIDPYTYWGHFLRQWNLTTVSSAAQIEGVYGDSYVH